MQNSLMSEQRSFRQVKIFAAKKSQSNKERKFVMIQYYDISLEFIAEKIQGILYEYVQNLRLFTMEGVEIFEEDMKYMGENTTLVATNSKNENFSQDGQVYGALQTLKEYKILLSSEEMGNGHVCKAQNKWTGEIRAIKYLQGSQFTNAEEVINLYREAEILTQCNHPNIVKLYNCISLSSMKIALIMDYFEGGTLKDLLDQSGRLQECDAKRYMVQMVEGLLYCHNRGISHRNIKLENIMFQEKGRNQLKIIDFGLSNLKPSQPEERLNYFKYQPPEYYKENNRIKSLGPHIDVWCLGLILYAMLSGKLPFEGDTVEDISQNIVREDYDEVVLECSDDGKNLLMILLEKSYKERIHTCEILRHPWFDSTLKLKTIKLDDLRLTTLRRSDSKPKGKRVIIDTDVNRSRSNTEKTKSPITIHLSTNRNSQINTSQCPSPTELSRSSSEKHLQLSERGLLPTISNPKRLSKFYNLRISQLKFQASPQITPNHRSHEGLPSEQLQRVLVNTLTPLTPVLLKKSSPIRRVVYRPQPKKPQEPVHRNSQLKLIQQYQNIFERISVLDTGDI